MMAAIAAETMTTHTTASLPFDAATVEFDPLLRSLNLANHPPPGWRESLQRAGPSYRTQHLDPDIDGAELEQDEPARVSGKNRPGFPEPTDHIHRVIVANQTRRR